MLTCLEIINILYIKCVTFCENIKNSYNSTFNDRRHRPEVYNNNNIIIVIQMSYLQQNIIKM